MVSKPYEWTRELFLEQMLQDCISHLDLDGRVLDANGKPLLENKDQPQESPHYDGLFILYDGQELLSKVHDIITRKKKPLTWYKGIDSAEKFKAHFRETGFGDKVSFYDTHAGTIARATGAITNAYEGIDESDLIEYGIPFDILAPDGSIEKDDIGTKTAAALVNSKAHKGVGAVVVSTSEYELGGKVLHMKDGMLVEECFARYDEIKNVIEIVNRKYTPQRNGSIYIEESTTAFASFYRPDNNPDRNIKNQPLEKVVEKNKPYEIFHHAGA